MKQVVFNVGDLFIDTHSCDYSDIFLLVLTLKGEKITTYNQNIYKDKVVVSIFDEYCFTFTNDIQIKVE